MARCVRLPLPSPWRVQALNAKAFTSHQAGANLSRISLRSFKEQAHGRYQMTPATFLVTFLWPAIARTVAGAPQTVETEFFFLYFGGFVLFGSPHQNLQLQPVISDGQSMGTVGMRCATL